MEKKSKAKVHKSKKAGGKNEAVRNLSPETKVKKLGEIKNEHFYLVL